VGRIIGSERMSILEATAIVNAVAASAGAFAAIARAPRTSKKIAPAKRSLKTIV
jgi:hypothetical protein